MENIMLDKRLVEYRKKVEEARAKAKKEAELHALKKEYAGYKYRQLKRVGKGFWTGARKVMEETGRTFSPKKPVIKKVVKRRKKKR